MIGTILQPCLTPAMWITKKQPMPVEVVVKVIPTMVKVKPIPQPAVLAVKIKRTTRSRLVAKPYEAAFLRKEKAVGDILAYIANNPSCIEADIRKALNLKPTFCMDILKICSMGDLVHREKRLCGNGFTTYYVYWIKQC
jgi:hypothetical protein